jgi:hypothetical protein
MFVTSLLWLVPPAHPTQVEAKTNSSGLLKTTACRCFDGEPMATRQVFRLFYPHQLPKDTALKHGRFVKKDSSQAASASPPKLLFSEATRRESSPPLPRSTPPLSDSQSNKIGEQQREVKKEGRDHGEL